MEKQQIYVGLVGYGLSGKYFHAPFINADRRFILSKVVERHEEESKKTYPEVEIVKSLDELLKDKLIDLVIIATPDSLHFEMATKALENGKHVVLEKPFTINSNEALELIKLAKKHKRILSVYHNRRWDGDFLTVREVIEKGWLGELVEFESQMSRYNPGDRRASWREKNDQGIGLLYDLGPHLIDQAIVLFGKPISIIADIRKQRGKDLDDYFDLWLDYGELKVRLKSGLLMREAEPRFILHGTKGSFIKYGSDPQENLLYSGISPLDINFGIEKEKFWGKINTEIDGRLAERNIETFQGNYSGYYDNIYDAIANGKEIEVKSEDAIKVIEIIERAYESNGLKSIVKLEE